jgi:hypothetical protein
MSRATLSKPAALRALLEERSIPEPNTGCWIWLGALTGRGYGALNVDGRLRVVHRVSFEVFIGPIGKGQVVRHLVCDNPPCINPGHLAAGSQLDNVRDMFRHGRAAVGDKNGARTKPETRCRGERATKAKLTAEKVLQIRVLVHQGATRAEVARCFGVSWPAIAGICSGRCWRHLPGFFAPSNVNPRIDQEGS